jgi:hypothetical protein
MTESQASFLKRLSADAGEEFDATLSKGAASRRIDELLSRGKGGGARPRTRKAASRSAPRQERRDGQMSEAQAAYLKELAEEEGGEYDPELTKEEASRRIGELLVKQMARRKPTEPPF